MTRRAGFSLTELMVALGLFSVLLVTTLGFYREQGRAFAEGNERATLMQNLRYGIDALEQNLRAAGIGVAADQPVLVYADDRVITFNGNYGTVLPNDFFALYYDPRLPAGAVSAPTLDRRFTIPGTSFSYPGAEYHDGIGNSPAETITFFFAPDPTTARTDDFALFRQVNDLQPEVIARDLVETDAPFFTFERFSAGAGSTIEPVPESDLPLRHAAPTHRGASDVGSAAEIDRVVAVSVAYGATNGLGGSQEAERELRRLIRLPNAGVAAARRCGEAPRFETVLTAVGVDQTASEDGYIRLDWSPSVDEAEGERDVFRYVIWRMDTSNPAAGDPLVSVAAGAGAYVYQDRTAEPDRYYTYAVAAQDCTPQFSPTVRSGSARWSP